MPNQCFLFQTHFMHPEVERRFQDLSEQTSGLGDAHILYHRVGKSEENLTHYPHYIISNDIISALGYRKFKKGLKPGATHFPALKYHRDHRQYDYYWVIENDVQFTADWGQFFEYFIDNPADFLACHMTTQPLMPIWNWWKLKHPNSEIPINERIRSFNPIFRASFRAMAAMHALLKTGWLGHHEVAMPTLFKHIGLKIEDIGGNGPFVPEGRQDMFYTKQTFTDRPAIKAPGKLVGKLYHPVKSW